MEKGMQLYLPWLGGQDKNLEQGFTNYWLLNNYLWINQTLTIIDN
jgi:hypothetical protein